LWAKVPSSNSNFKILWNLKKKMPMHLNEGEAIIPTPNSLTLIKESPTCDRQYSNWTKWSQHQILSLIYDGFERDQGTSQQWDPWAKVPGSGWNFKIQWIFYKKMPMHVNEGEAIASTPSSITLIKGVTNMWPLIFRLKKWPQNVEMGSPPG
jgi:hypothetical protein